MTIRLDVRSGMVGAMDLDVEFARSYFPALTDDWAFMDNAGGSLLPRPVIELARGYMERYQVQLGASYPRSVEAQALVNGGRQAAADLLGAELDEVVIGPSTTANLGTLARALAPGLKPGDAVVVTNLDHESNIGCWRQLEAQGVEVRQWCVRPDTCLLSLEDLEPLLTGPVRLVCCTHVSNVVGAIHDVRAIADRVHAANALLCVDGVAFAPHRRVDVKALDVDFYAVSLYKVFGPHLGALYGRRELLRQAQGQNHFFIGEDDVPYKLQPGNVNHELTASLAGIHDYFAALDERHHPGAEPDGRLERVFDLFARHEERLVERVLDWLAQRPGVRVLGPGEGGRDVRVPTVGFTVQGLPASRVVEALEKQQLAVRWGDFYARRAIVDLGLESAEGVVRVSLAHYNSQAEIDRLLAALDRACSVSASRPSARC